MTSPASEGETRKGAVGEVRSLAVSSLRLAESRYAPLGGDDSGTDAEAILAKSLRELGQLCPILVHEAAPGELHIVDGFTRARAATSLGWESLSCAVLGRETPIEHVLGLVIGLRRTALMGNAVTRARLVALAVRERLAEDLLREWLLPALGLQGHQSIVKRCLAIAELPAPVAEFCAAKGFSLKQCTHLTRHPRELLELVFSWRDRINLTASLAEELLDDLGDYVRATAMAPADLAGHDEIRAVLESGAHPQRAARALRDRVRALRAPVLTGTNRRMDALAGSLQLPESIRLTWDRSLERRELGVHVTLRDPHQWREALASLRREEVGSAVAALLEEL